MSRRKSFSSRLASPAYDGLQTDMSIAALLYNEHDLSFFLSPPHASSLVTDHRKYMLIVVGVAKETILPADIDDDDVDDDDEKTMLAQKKETPMMRSFSPWWETGSGRGREAEKIVAFNQYLLFLRARCPSRCGYRWCSHEGLGHRHGEFLFADKKESLSSASCFVEPRRKAKKDVKDTHTEMVTWLDMSKQKKKITSRFDRSINGVVVSSTLSLAERCAEHILLLLRRGKEICKYLDDLPSRCVCVSKAS